VLSLSALEARLRRRRHLRGHLTQGVGGLLPGRTKGWSIDPTSSVSPRSALAALRTHASLAGPLIILAACAAAAALLAGEELSVRNGSFPASLATVVVALLATGFGVYRRTGASVWLLTISPFAIAAVTWSVLFVLRPVELYFFPDHAALALGQLGYDVAALTRTVALASLGCSAWCAGYLIALGRQETAEARTADSPRGSWIVAGFALALGTALWVALFLRQGGIGALVHSLVSVRTGQGSSFYGFVGVWIVQGTALYALALLLSGRRRGARGLRCLFCAAVALAALAAVALQLRGLALFGALSALTISLRLRPPSRRTIAVAASLALIAVLGLAFAQQTRAYTSRMPASEAVHTAVRTPLWALYASDLSTYDDFVAIRELVPGSIPSLNGATLREVPQALVPRSLWPDKPVGVDSRVASYLYPGVPVAVPISIQGELYWNGGLLAVAVGSLILGAAFGRLGRFGLRARPGSPSFVLYAVAFPFTHAFLTRGLATMTENLLFALAGVSFAILALSFRPQPLSALRGARLLRNRVSPSPLPERRGAGA